MGVENIDFVEGVFEDMQRLGLVRSKSEFSEHMLGKATSYLTSMRARDRNVPGEVVDHMRSALAEHIVAFDAMIVASETNLSRQYEMTVQSRKLLAKIDRRLSVTDPETSPAPATSGFIAQILRVAGLPRFRHQPVSTGFLPTLH
jgi:hypothetical protein